MGLFKKIFGNETPPSPGNVPEPRPAGDPSKDPNLVKVYDKYGRELFISKEQWRKDILPGALKSNWHNPDQLAGIIIQSLGDVFFVDVLKAAERLHQIDTAPARGACVYAIVLKENGSLEKAEAVLKTYLEKHGEEGSVLTNLAKIYSVKNETKKANETLWRGLEVDPNQENGLGWFFATERERGGESSGVAALSKIAALPGSWRAQLWLAGYDLKVGNWDKALNLYRESLIRVGQPVPTDLLMQMSGDLGKSGRLQDLLELTEPYFVLETHGLKVGNNLIKAYIETGRLDDAGLMLERLFSLKRMDWQEALAYWDTEIAKARLEKRQTDHSAPPPVQLLQIKCPIWLESPSPAVELFPLTIDKDAFYYFMGSSAEVPRDTEEYRGKLSDTPGRLSRSLPLFFAEQVYFQGQVSVQTLIPWVTGENPGFVLAGGPFGFETVRGLVDRGIQRNGFVILTHLKTTSDPWRLELVLFRVSDGQSLGNLSVPFVLGHPEEKILPFTHDLLDLLAKETGLVLKQPPSLYQVPAGGDFSYYLLRLEQLLAVRCASMKESHSGFLNGEREIIQGNLQLCLAQPKNVVTRLLFIRTLAGMKKLRADVLLECKEKVKLLQKENPLPGAAQGVAQAMLDQIFT